MRTLIWPYVVAFFLPLVFTLVLTPLVREMNRRLGMVDKPDPRRINKTPIPRGGGLAIVLGLYLAYVLFWQFFDRPVMMGTKPGMFWKMSVLSICIAALGYVDDKFSLKPRVKLLGQAIVAFFVWSWAGLGFQSLWPSLPAPIDCVLTLFWIVGAINAYNLIDGLDGLASGLALIAMAGMTGAMFFTQSPGATFFPFAIMGAILGFLRYNYNPASVFLGDCGSMFLGFVVSSIPLASHVPNSFMVSVGVPLLAMGVPIFDTSLAILRRSVRHLLVRQSKGAKVGNDRVMTADIDHLHHRILRSVGMNQRRAAWTLYILATAAVVIGLVGLSLQSRAAGLWLLALSAAVIVVFRDTEVIELFDMGRLMANAVHNTSTVKRRARARRYVPLLVASDIFLLCFAYLVSMWALRIPLRMDFIRTSMLIFVFSTFVSLIVFHAYGTIWSRAQLSNFLRLLLACVIGTVIGTFFVYYTPHVPARHYKAFLLIYALLSFFSLSFIRVFRGIVRDCFYIADCARLRRSAKATRVLVYGAGLRYRSFRRELVRTASLNKRTIVGIIDDDVTLRGKMIGGMRILGTLNQAPSVIEKFDVNEVVITCVLSEDWLKIVKDTLKPTGVRITQFIFKEEEVT